MGVRKKSKNQIMSAPRERGKKSSPQPVFADEEDGIQDPSEERKRRVWQVVSMIPKGKVASYGQIAKLIGLPSHARFVGATLRNLPKRTKLPWYRVVNASLRISLRGGGEARQRTLLEAEGVTFIGDRVLKAHRWQTEGTDVEH